MQSAHHDAKDGWWDRQALKSAKRMLRHHGHMSRRMSVYRLLPFCADLPDMVVGFSREVAQAEYRGRLLAYPFRQRIRAEATLAGLAAHYRAYRRHNRRILIASALDPRRLVRGRAPRCAVYWKKTILLHRPGRWRRCAHLLPVRRLCDITFSLTRVGRSLGPFMVLLSGTSSWLRFWWCAVTRSRRIR